MNVWTFRGLVGIAMLAIVASTLPAAYAQAPITLQAAVDVALSEHPSVAAAQQALVAAQAGLAVAQAPVNLQVSVAVQSTYGNSANFPTGGPTTTTTTLPVAASLQLVNQQIQYQVDQARAAVVSAQASLVQARQDVGLTAGQAYFSVLRAQAVVATREVAVAQTDAQVRQAEAQVRAGVAARADVLQTQAALAAAQVDLIAARNQVETALAGLRSAMGRPLTDSVAVAQPQPPQIVPLSREQAIAAASGRPEVLRAHSSVVAAQAALALAEVKAQPQLSVGTSATVDMSRLPGDPKYLVWGVGATISYPLVDGGLADATVIQARANLANAQAQEVLAFQTVRVDALNSWVAWQDATSRVDATRASETAAAEALRAAEGRYRAGVGTIVEVLTARTTFESASLSRIQAEFDVQTAVLQLRHAVGQPVIGSS